MNNLNMFEDEVKKYKDGVHILNRGATAEEIQQAEKDLSVTLPTAYKELLRLHNGGELFGPGGTEISKVLEKGETAQLGRSYVNFGFQKTKICTAINSCFLPIAHTSYGDIIYIDLKTGGVVKWSHEDNQIDQRWSDVITWLMEVMESGRMFIDYEGNDKDIF